MDDVLLDTNVISELIKPKPDPNVVKFLRDTDAPWISTITLHELVYGAERAPDSRRRVRLLGWIAQVASQFANRTIAVDPAIAEVSGRFRAFAAAEGRPATPIDTIIAASAHVRGLRLVTRNTKDFEVFGISLTNPWEP